MRKKVFISHPYKDHPEINIARAEYLILSLNKKYKDEVLFISPLHTFSYFKKEEEGYRDDIMDACYRLIDISDEVWTGGSKGGCLLECEYGLNEGKGVYVIESVDKLYKLSKRSFEEDLKSLEGVYTYRLKDLRI